MLNNKTLQPDLRVEFENSPNHLSELLPFSPQDFEKIKSSLFNSCYQYRDD